MIGLAKPIHVIVKTNLDAVQSGNLIVSLVNTSSSQLDAGPFPAFQVEELRKGAFIFVHHSRDGTFRNFAIFRLCIYISI